MLINDTLQKVNLNKITRFGNLMKHKITISYLLFLLSLASFVLVASNCNVLIVVFCYPLSFFLLFVMLFFLIVATVLLVS